MATDQVGESQDALEMIATGEPLPAVLDALCRAIDSQSGLTTAVFLLDSEARHLTLAAAPHLPDAWRQAVSSVVLTPGKSGACGTAISRREPVTVPDVTVDPTYEPFRDAARAAGIATVWSTPFFAKDRRVLGTFAVHSRSPGPPLARHLQLVERATHLASIAVERSQTEDGLRKSEQLLRLVLDALPVGVGVVNPAGDMILTNPASQALWSGIIHPGPRRYAESKGWWHATGQRLAPGEWPSARALKGESSVHNVLDIEAFDGVRKVIQNSSIAIRDAHDRITGAVIVNEDITERIVAERKLKDSYEQAQQQHERWRSVFENSTIGIVLADPDGHIVETNRAFQELLGYGAEELRTLTFKDISHPADIRPGESAQQQLLSGQRREVQLEKRYRHKNGAFIWVRATGTVIAGSDGSPRYLLGLVEDVTGRKAAERDLDDSVRQLRALAGRLMHAQDDERRRIAQLLHETTAQDLAALKMLLARLNRTSSDLSNDDRTALAESIALAEQAMTEIRTLSYLLHPPFLDEAGLLSALRWYVAGFAERSGIKVDLDLPQEFERLPLDTETALFRIVQETLMNTHRHARSATARIRLQRTADVLVLDIEDHGRGIPAASLATIATGGGAAGVGIPGISERIEQLGGSLEIASSDRGTTGTTVRVRLPLGKDAG